MIRDLINASVKEQSRVKEENAKTSETRSRIIVPDMNEIQKSLNTSIKRLVG